MNVQIIEKDGKPDYAILPYAEYQGLLDRLEDKEDREDIAAYRSGQEEVFPSEVVDALLDGENPIKAYRKFRGVTQQGLADAIGKSKVYIAKLEARTGDTRSGTVEVISAIAEVLRVDIDQLV